MDTSPVRFRSTNHTVEGYTLGQALLTGMAPDKGLFLPHQIPPLSREELVAMRDLPYPELAFRLLRKYLGDEMTERQLQDLCTDAYDYEVPLDHVYQRRHVMRLDRGPTASFKDFAARWMGRMLGHLVRTGGGQDLVILTATSGDTGSAVAQAFHNVEGIHCVVLFPVDEVSNRQRKQMTTIGDNVTTIGVDGKFDDCQTMVKRAFSDPEVSHIRLSSANSINIGRLLPQSVYYVYAYLKLADVEAGEPIIFCVPSGNFGDLCGGLLAHRAGLPVQRWVVATNANDEVPIFFDTERYDKIVPSRTCISNAMNVGHPSNLARLVDFYGGHLDEVGIIHRLPVMDDIRRDMWSIPVDDAWTRRTIVEAWEQHQTILEPHGAVGWAALEAFFEAGEAPADALAVSLETAHPAKFPDEIRALIGVDPQPPPALAGLDELPEHYEAIDVDYDRFKSMLRKQFD